MRFQRRPSPDLNTPPAGVHNLPHLLFRTWDDLIKKFRNIAREVTKKRSEKFIPIKVIPATWEACGTGEVFEGVEEAA